MKKTTGILQTIILAGGKGTRMKSKTPKVLHKILEKELVSYTIDCAKKLDSKEIIVVVGDQSEKVKAAIKDDVTFVLQEEQLGTGHAVMMCNDFIEDESTVLIICGDTPALNPRTFSAIYHHHIEQSNSLTVVSNILEDPTGYGRIVRDKDNFFSRIVEQKDADEEILKIKEVNSGVYIFKGKDLKEALKELKNENSQNEYYLTDTIEILLNKGLNVSTFIAKNPTEFLGINTKVQLAEVSEIIRKRINEQLMLDGVIIIDPNTTYISPTVKIGMDTIIRPNTSIFGNTIIGEDCDIAGSTLTDMKINNGVTILNSVCTSSSIDDNTTVGPFAYIRPNCKIGKKVKVGDFVEVKNSIIGDNSKASHLTYIGDSELGKNINLGCGTITVNYDGKNKFKTIIEDDVFVGCNSNLIAPVTLKKGSTIGAGTTVTKDVPEDSLAIGRVKQENKVGWKQFIK